MGIRVGIANEPLLGFVVTREGGWFDIMVNGGSAVTLHLQREPFLPTQKTITIPSNEIVVIDPIVMRTEEENRKFLLERRVGNYECFEHDYDHMKGNFEVNWGNAPCAPDGLFSDGHVLHESLPIPNTGLSLVYNSSRASGYRSVIELQLTPRTIPSSLRLVHLRVAVEGNLFEKVFEADPSLRYTFAWNRRNVYRQKVFGVGKALISVGYEYSNCPKIIWDEQSAELPGHDMSISEIGGWNLNIHHRYNFHEGILQKGDGTDIYLKKKSPANSSSGHFQIVSKDGREVYFFNRHGLHVSTRSALSGDNIYNFTYDVNTSFGKLIGVVDSDGNRLQFLRDYSNQVKEIETSSGVKCRIEMSRMRMLESYILPDATKITFQYTGITGLIKSKSDNKSGHTFTYEYDKNGRLVRAVGPDDKPLKCFS